MSKLIRSGRKGRDEEKILEAGGNDTVTRNSTFEHSDAQRSTIYSNDSTDGRGNIVGSCTGSSGCAKQVTTKSLQELSRCQKNANVKCKGSIDKKITNVSITKNGPSVPESTLLSFMLSGKDVVASVSVSSNHRYFYLIPLTSVLVSLPKPSVSGARQYPQVVILVASKVIAAGIRNDVEQLLRHTGKRAVTACCGVKYEVQRKQILLGCDLIIGTAQRLLAFITEGKIALQFVKIIVIDRVEDVDEKALKSLMEHCPKVERQVCLFTRGMTTQCQQCIRDYLRSDFLYVSLGKLGSRTASALSVKHLVIDVSGASKNEFMSNLLNDFGKRYLANSDREVKIIVFLDSVTTTGEVIPIVKLQLPWAQLIGLDDKQTNTERKRAIEQFKRCQSVVLMMCEACSCEDFLFTVDLLIFHDIPSKSEVYFQLVCTVGENGTVATLYDRHIDLFKSVTILTALKNAKQKPPYWLCDDSLRAVVKSDL
ncbi:hypothetical protein M514_00634 [Trichuris suis]|uniref:Helicase ATP-binding domain-containing protein n=1 Tax=Trichuris suis TaxID=68888 RepID=A0A085N731_9BILA|nr:hypothetical protein M514_00634 [Trichuris suis]KHJ44302.1 hypothetical protein D918_05663 [Trichuris suis]